MSMQTMLKHLPFLTPDIIAGSTVEYYDKDQLLADGDTLKCTALHVVLEGDIRIFTMDEEGKEVTLYEVKEKELCINSVAHLISDVQYKVFARANTRVKILNIPKGLVDEVLLKDQRFVKYIITKMMHKMNDLAKHYQLNVLKSIDERLEAFLTKRFQHSKHIYITHKALAQEIGTSREVVSRKLKKLEKAGKIRLAKGKISL